MKNWYSREFLGRSFDRFLKSDMKQTDFLQLQSELQSVSVQLRELNSFIESGSLSRTGKTHTKPKEEKGSFS